MSELTGRLRSRLTALVAVGLLLVPITGCTNSDGRDEARLPEKNREQWVMPLDQYMVTSAHSLAESYLRALHSQQCLTRRGFAHSVPSPDLAASRDGEDRSVFSVRTAPVFGYGGVIVSHPGDEEWIEFIYRERSETESNALDECVRETVVDPEVPGYDNHQLNFALQMAGAAFSGALQDPAVLTAAQGWRECMSGAGIDDLPETPDRMPTPSMQARYSGFAERPSAAETADAVRDAECRESSGYAEALYEAEWSRQVELIGSNEAALTEIARSIHDVDAAVQEQLARLAPGT